MELVVISGLVEGKDTIGNIIQALGQKQDDTDMGFPTWEIKKFAFKLKKIAFILTGIPQEKFEDQEFKKTFLDNEWDYKQKLPRESLEQENIYWENKKMTVREFLQKLGTEGIRDGLHTNAWVNALFADYKPLVSMEHVSMDMSEGGKIEQLVEPIGVEYPKWIVTDVRFPNEAQAIKDREGIIIRVIRKPKTEGEHLHASETSLDSWKFDKVIENNGTIEELMGKVKDAIGEYL